MYTKSFEIRWSDLDANRHLANSAYTNFMSHARMAYLIENGFDQATLEKESIGPVVFYEHTYYFREILSGPPVRVSLEVMGMSEDGMFFEFHHNFYDSKGRHMAHCEMMGGWMNLKTRKLTALTNELLRRFSAMEKGTGFRVLTKEDTRKHLRRPKDLD